MSLQALRSRLTGPAGTRGTRDTIPAVPPQTLSKQCRDRWDTWDTTKHRAPNASAFDRPLAEALATAADGLPITSRDLYEALPPEDVADWQSGKIGAEHLHAFAVALHAGREREAGRIPDSYEDIVTCGHCGPVWLDIPGDVPSCPWCLNRLAGLPIPRPHSITCGTCRHFRRGDHAHLGGCSVGIKACAAAGHWDTDHHACHRWLPHLTGGPDK